MNIMEDISAYTRLLLRYQPLKLFKFYSIQVDRVAQSV